MAAAVEKQLSTASEEYEDESLDPRVQVELEKLNKASEDINKLELELDEARASFRQVLTESTQKLNTLSKKLGSCIEKARCYYDARMKAKEAQIQSQNVALRFERACSQQMAAKEMVYLAEQGFFKKGQPFDPAWQEMLNHATMKVNEAERERLESEIEHQVTTRVFNECEQRVKQLQKELKRNIAKSRPYFEQKARFNQTMEEQKRLVSMLEQAVADSKMMYSEALRNLETISDEIHQLRKDAQLRKEMGTRGSGVGAEEPHPPPHDGQPPDDGQGAPGHLTVNRTNSQTQTESEMLQTNNDVLQALTSNGDLNHEAVGKRTSESEQNKVSQNNVDPQDSQKREDNKKVESVAKPEPAGPVSGVPKSLFKVPLSDSDKDRQYLTVEDTETVSETVSSTEMLTPGSGPPSVHTTSATSPETEHEPEAHVESTKTNMEIMETLQKAKNFKSPFLSLDNLLDEASDNESIPGSMASVSVLDDDQLESLMLETGDFVNFLVKQDEMEAEKIKSRTLPAKLSYLQNYMNFKSEFIETNNAKVGGPTVKDGTSAGSDSTDFTSQEEGDLDDSSAKLETTLDTTLLDQQEVIDTTLLDQQEVIDTTLLDQQEVIDTTLLDQQEVIDSTDYDACWSCEIDTDDIPDKRPKHAAEPHAKSASLDRPPSHSVATGQEQAGARCSRGYSFEEDSEFQRVYKELSAFEKLMRSPSSEESSSPQSPPVVAPSSLPVASEDSVQITVTPAESSPECQKDPLGVMPVKAIAKVGSSTSSSSSYSSSNSNDKSCSTSKPQPVENVEHFV